MAKTKVTLHIEEKVWREFRAWAIQRGSNGSREVEDFMRESLMREAVPTEGEISLNGVEK